MPRNGGAPVFERKIGRSTLWYREPASEWIEGLPIGNGTLGGMVLGGVAVDRIGLNHDHLWRRYWTYHDRNTAPDIPRVRELCRSGRWEEAFHALDAKVMRSGRGIYLNPYVPLCDLYICPVLPGGSQGGYERRLDLETAVVTVCHEHGGVVFTRRYFASAVAGVIAINLKANHAGCLSGEVGLARLADPDCRVWGTSDLGTIVLEGLFEEGVRFAAAVRVIQRGGRLTSGRPQARDESEPVPRQLGNTEFIFRKEEPGAPPFVASTCFEASDEVTLLVAAATERERPDDPAGWCRDHLANIDKDFESLLDEHVRDYRKYFGRVQLRLGSGGGGAPTEDRWSGELPAEELSTEERVKRAEGGGAPAADPFLIEQLFHMGRYLAISSARPGTAPINLQGIWNQDRRPAWDCDYHLDMNVQMSHWPLEMANLSECVEPLFDWAERLVPQARHAARDLYGCRGIYFPTVNDLYSIGNLDNLCIWWTGAAAWLGQHFWAHWEYTQDREFLERRAYPFLKEVGAFYEDFLTEDGEGRLVPCPSASPEVGVKGLAGFLSPPSTMDLELIREVFTNLLTASAILGVDEGLRATWQGILDRVPLPRIGARGQLLEWLEDVEPADPYHRHLSHLVGLSPGTRITRHETPEHFAAAAVALDERAGRPDSGCGWNAVWLAHAYVRLGNAEAAMNQIRLYCSHYLVKSLLSSIVDWRETGTGVRWFGGQKVFQIEACIGMVSVVAEMLLQDRGGLLTLLPALPADWKEGSVSGLRARGGFEVDVTWRDGRFAEATIRSLAGNRCRLLVNGFGSGPLRVFDERGEIAPRPGPHETLEFETRKGGAYRVTL